MNNKILFKCLPIFLSLVLVFGCSINAFAYDGGSNSYMWDGDLLFHDQDFTIPLLQTFANNELTNSDGDTVFRYKSASFDGSVSNLLRITGTPGTYLNGTAHTTYTFTTAEYEDGTISVALASNVYDGMTVTSQNASYVGNRTVINVHVNFSNFEITSSQMYFPIQFNVSYSNRYDETFDIVPSAVLIRCVGNDWTDEVTMYTSMEDLPGSKGVIGRFFDGIKTHLTSLFNGLKQNDNENANLTWQYDLANSNMIANQIYNTSEKINNQNILNSQNENKFNAQNSQNEINAANTNSQAEIAQSKENTDNLMNGFDTKKSDSTASTIDQGLMEYEMMEEAFFQIGDLGLESFTWADTLPDGMYETFDFVGTILQSIFEASGSFGFIVSCSFTFIIFRMLSGQTKFL